MERLYVAARTDLACSSPAVQAGHALAAFMLAYPDRAAGWGNRTLVYLHAGSEEDLARLAWKLEREDEAHASFREPDLGDELTAVAFESKKEARRMRLLA